MNEPDLGEPERWSTLTTRVLAPNPGPMTLDGTNSYVIRASGSSDAVLVDPGPEIAEHLDRLAAHGPVELILLTHHHLDHAESAATMSARTGAPVRAWEPSLCIDAEPLRDGEVVTAAGTRVVVIATPGHTSDSVCFQLPDDGPLGGGERCGSILTGDTILGRGTTVLVQAHDAVRDYLRSIESLRRLDRAELMLPAHGPSVPSLLAIADEYLMHRHQRLDQVRGALASLGIGPSQDVDVIQRVTDCVYPNIAADIRFAAEASAAAQLEYLASAD